MDRTVPFDEKAICDSCGKTGAYDFYGDFLCPECAAKVVDSEDVEDDIHQRKP